MVKWTYIKDLTSMWINPNFFVCTHKEMYSTYSATKALVLQLLSKQRKLKIKLFRFEFCPVATYNHLLLFS